jgi:hypothetical protein
MIIGILFGISVLGFEFMFRAGVWYLSGVLGFMVEV